MDMELGLEFDARHALAYVRKQSLDIYNRLHSIREDVRFVRQVHDAYPTLPILPNLRCGAWYVDPAIATDTPAYFKSTDGHFGNWSFNLRRPNLHLLPLIIDHHGVILVDSTRAGKRIPDALSKTVPIWCAVINRAMLLLHPEKTEHEEEWDTELYCPPGAVSEQERVQIEARLDEWALALSKSAYTLPDLPLPLRPLWITPATSVFPRLPDREELACIPVICLSASQQVGDGLERRSHGFSYVQGSGDDHELWGMGLTPHLFWSHEDKLLNSTREDLPALVAELVAQSKARTANDTWTVPPTAIAAVSGRILVGAVPDMPTAPLWRTLDDGQAVSYVVISDGPGTPPPSPPPTPPLVDGPSHDSPPHDGAERSNASVLRLRMAEGKKGQLHFLQHVLPTAVRYIRERLEKGDAVCVCCDSGKDASVGVALAALQLFFDDNGKPLLGENADGTGAAPSKHSIRTRLQWIIASRPLANPSRATLKRVNEFLLSAPSLRRK
ncbi:initiator tRNA phosphoribosyl transferase [Trametes elegans]|nr:initiator tRNA phosphoribosyl transferase [Trametes elegans]